LDSFIFIFIRVGCFKYSSSESPNPTKIDPHITGREILIKNEKKWQAIMKF